MVVSRVRVVVPFTRLDDRTRDRLDQHAPGWVGYELDPARPDAYHHLLAAQWDDHGTDLVTVEHDIGIHAGVLPGFDACPEPWCAHAYPIGAQMLPCLGCTRFRAGLKAAFPDLFTQLARDYRDGSPPMDWRRLDVRLAGELQCRGWAVHVHQPPVEHYHEYPEV